MASLNIAFGGGALAAAAASGRGRKRSVLVAATSSKNAGKSSTTEEKGIFDWIMSGLEKDQLLETDPLLNKVEGKNGSISTQKSSPPPAPKSGGFSLGGLFKK